MLCHLGMGYMQQGKEASCHCKQETPAGNTAFAPLGKILSLIMLLCLQKAAGVSAGAP